MEDVVKYTVENNKLIQWCHGDAKVIEVPAIMYDKEDDLLLKHGEKADVEAYYRLYTESLSLISADMAEQAVLISFENSTPEKTAKFLNLAISVTGCISKQLKEHFRAVYPETKNNHSFEDLER